MTNHVAYILDDLVIHYQSVTNHWNSILKIKIFPSHRTLLVLFICRISITPNYLVDPNLRIKNEGELVRFFKYSHPIKSYWQIYSAFFILILGFFLANKLLNYIGYPLFILDEGSNFFWIIMLTFMILILFGLNVWINRNYYNEGITYNPHQNTVSQDNLTLQLSNKCEIYFEYYSKIRFDGKIRSAKIKCKNKEIELPVQSIGDIEKIKQVFPTSMQSQFIGTELVNEIPKSEFNSSNLNSITYYPEKQFVLLHNKINLLNSIITGFVAILLVNFALGIVFGIVWLMEVSFEGSTQLPDDSMTKTFGIPFFLLINLMFILSPSLFLIKQKKLTINLKPDSREIGFFDNQFKLSYEAILRTKNFVYNDKEYTDTRIEDHDKIIPLPFITNKDLVREFISLIKEKLKIPVEAN